MGSTPNATRRAIQPASQPQSSSGPPASLVAALAAVPDPRRPEWPRFPLPAVLALSVAAVLANHLSVLAIAQWGAAQSREVLAALGVPDGVTPHQTTWQRLFRRLDPAPLAAALTAYCAAAPAPGPPASDVGHPPRLGPEGVASDGKAQRGRLVGQDATAQTVHTVSLGRHHEAVVLAQVPVETQADGVAAELSVAPALLAQLDWRGRVLTGDAWHCQRHLCQQVCAAGGDYLFTVKANQPTLDATIRRLFDPPPDDATVAAPTDQRRTRQVAKGHGRLEVRPVGASTDLAAYLDWPGRAQVCRRERTWQERGPTQSTVRYGITQPGTPRRTTRTPAGAAARPLDDRSSPIANDKTEYVRHAGWSG